jgi:Replication initiator protein, pSAM2
LPTDPLPASTIRHAGGCLQLVLLPSSPVDHIDGATGELLHRYTTVCEPGGVLPIACKTRRATRCPPCAEVYRADTYQLIRAGLSGGKGIPETVAAHPCVLATLTAPSFGTVHAHREKNSRSLACHPRRGSPACLHGQPQSCKQRAEAVSTIRRLKSILQIVADSPLRRSCPSCARSSRARSLHSCSGTRSRT